VTVVSYGAAGHLAAEAVGQLVDHGIDAELIDLRVLCPLDWETVARSVAKTSRCIVVQEDYAEYGVAAEITSRVASECFSDLDAPVGRVGARFWPIPFSPPLEEQTLPSVDRVREAILALAAF
jgi:pyruvate/2-oxoglutarate/acetoin dehydrogenase E1 component